MKNLLIAAGLLFMFSCNNPDVTTTTVTTDSTTAPGVIVPDNTTVHDTVVVVEKNNDNPTNVTGCYQMVIGRDSAFLKLNGNQNAVSGNLWYKWSQKDNNRGTVTGSVNGDLIVLMYKFMSEGMTSYRQEVFKIDGTNLLHGSGEYNMGSDTMKFKNINTLQFDQANPFQKTACNKNF